MSEISRCPIEACSDGEHSDLAIAIRRYQAGELEPWSDVILSLMDGRLRAAAGHLHPAAGLIDSEDLRQQLAAELLAMAKGLRLDAEEWIPRMLMERALRNVRRWRERQVRVPRHPLVDEVAAGESAGHDAASCMSLLIEAGLNGMEAEILVNHHVNGEPFGAMARRLGVSEPALRSRASRAAARVRQAGEQNLSAAAGLTCAARGMKRG
ncbi:MAG TPA: hypothetical protein VNV65_04945 [Candidatus Solibacter sp.]|nr:hypothetical protein [Candidatus Solibacter sp.]